MSNTSKYLLILWFLRCEVWINDSLKEEKSHSFLIELKQKIGQISWDEWI